MAFSPVYGTSSARKPGRRWVPECTVGPSSTRPRLTRVRFRLTPPQIVPRNGLPRKKNCQGQSTAPTSAASDGISSAICVARGSANTSSGSRKRSQSLDTSSTMFMRARSAISTYGCGTTRAPSSAATDAVSSLDSMSITTISSQNRSEGRHRRRRSASSWLPTIAVTGRRSDADIIRNCHVLGLLDFRDAVAELGEEGEHIADVVGIRSDVARVDLEEERRAHRPQQRLTSPQGEQLRTFDVELERVDHRPPCRLPPAVEGSDVDGDRPGAAGPARVTQTVAGRVPARVDDELRLS